MENTFKSNKLFAAVTATRLATIFEPLGLQSIIFYVIIFRPFCHTCSHKDAKFSTTPVNSRRWE